MGHNFCDIIDAGRLSTWKGLRTLDEYRKIFEGIEGMRILSEEPIYGDIMAYIWDIGLRPIFNPLAKLAGNVPLDLRSEVKQEWCSTMYDLTADLITNYEADGKNAIEWLFVLRKIG